MTQTNNEREALIEFKDAVKQLCNDFSSLQGNVYIKDVAASLDALCERFIESPISHNEQQEAVGYVRYQRCALNTRDANGDVYLIPHAHLTNRDVIDGAKLFTSPPKQAIPEGWKLVKIEDLQSLKDSIRGDYYQGEAFEIAVIEKMLNAAPTNTEVGE